MCKSNTEYTTISRMRERKDLKPSPSQYFYHGEEGLAKIRVWIDRDQCIADMVCVSLCPDVFEMSEEDGKSQIVAKWRTDPNNVGEGVVPEDLKDCVQSAVESCPVSIIHMEEIQE